MWIINVTLKPMIEVVRVGVSDVFPKSLFIFKSQQTNKKLDFLEKSSDQFNSI